MGMKHEAHRCDTGITGRLPCLSLRGRRRLRGPLGFAKTLRLPPLASRLYGSWRKVGSFEADLVISRV